MDGDESKNDDFLWETAEATMKVVISPLNSTDFWYQTEKNFLICCIRLKQVYEVFIIVW